MLKFLQDSGLLSERKARLFACACCRLVWQLLGERDHGAVEVAERFADGLASHEQLEAARETFRDWNSAATYQCNAAWATTHISAWDAAKGMSFFVTPLPRWHARRSGSQVRW